MRILVSLVGDQPVPNLIPLYDAARNEEPYDALRFMVSPKTSKTAKNLRDALKDESSLIDMEVLEPFCSVDPWDKTKAKNQCRQAMRSLLNDDKGKQNTIVVNLTGGTKIMSLAAYQASIDEDVPMIYVNTEREEIIHFRADGTSANPRPFRVKIPIATQLRVVGREISKPKDPSLISENDKQTVKWIANNYDMAYDQTLRKILEEVKRGEKKGPDHYPYEVSFAPVKGKGIAAIERYSQAGCLTWNEASRKVSIPNKEAWTFLNGDWVEKYAITTLDQSRFFDEVLGNVEISGTDGEVDVVVNYNGRIGIVECKTTGPAERFKLSDMAAKLRAHEMIWGGSYASSVFVRAAKRDRDVEKAAEQYGIKCVVNGPDLCRLAQVVAKSMGLH